MSRHRDMTKGGFTVWIDDVIVPAVHGSARVRLWTVWRETSPRRRIGSTQNPRAIKALVQEAQP